MKLNKNFNQLKLLALDVDGVLTTGHMIIGSKGEEFKIFHTHDGMGLELLRNCKILQAIITGENTPIVEKRAKKLKISEVHQGIKDKIAVIDFLCNKYKLKYENVGYIGDDINDLPVLQKIGFPFAVNNAIEKVKNVCIFVAKKKGGNGAVREICDYIISNLQKIKF